MRRLNWTGRMGLGRFMWISARLTGNHTCCYEKVKIANIPCYVPWPLENHLSLPFHVSHFYRVKILLVFHFMRHSTNFPYRLLLCLFRSPIMMLACIWFDAIFNVNSSSTSSTCGDHAVNAIAFNSFKQIRRRHHNINAKMNENEWMNGKKRDEHWNRQKQKVKRGKTLDWLMVLKLYMVCAVCRIFGIQSLWIFTFMYGSLSCVSNVFCLFILTVIFLTLHDCHFHHGWQDGVHHLQVEKCF